SLHDALPICSRLFSVFKRLTSADSSLVTPGRVPSSTSACASQRRTDSRETPSWRATAVTAAVRVGYSCWCSLTSRTHLARSWGSIFFGMLSILSDSNSSGIKPGPIHDIELVVLARYMQILSPELCEALAG